MNKSVLRAAKATSVKRVLEMVTDARQDGFRSVDVPCDFFGTNDADVDDYDELWLNLIRELEYRGFETATNDDFGMTISW